MTSESASHAHAEQSQRENAERELPTVYALGQRLQDTVQMLSRTHITGGEVSDLIEKVARLAGWSSAGSFTDDVQWYQNDEALTMVAAQSIGLTDYGLRILLDELLRAGWDVEYDAMYGKYVIGRNDGPAYQFTAADTLEEAVMAAYVAHREGK